MYDIAFIDHVQLCESHTIKTLIITLPNIRCYSQIFSEYMYMYTECEINIQSFLSDNRVPTVHTWV